MDELPGYTFGPPGSECVMQSTGCGVRGRTGDVEDLAGEGVCRVEGLVVVHHEYDVFR